MWDRLKYVKNPDTGKRQSRLNPPEQRIIKDLPELRIVPQELWDAVKARQAKMSRATRPDRRKADFWKHQRPRYLLSGLMKCGCCGANYTKYGANRFACAGARDRATCSNHLTIRGDDVDLAILRGLKARLMEPELDSRNSPENSGRGQTDSGPRRQQPRPACSPTSSASIARLIASLT